MGNAYYAACQWGMLVVIAKLGSPEQVGAFALALAICSPAILFANLDLRSVQATDARQQYRFRDYVRLRLFTIALFLLVVAGIALIAHFERRTRIVIVLLAVAKGVESASDILYGFFQKNERMDRVAKSLVLKGSLSLPALATGLYLSASIVWGVVGLCLAWGLLLISYDAANARALLRARQAGDAEASAPVPRSGPEARLPASRVTLRLAWLAAPLGVAAMLTSLNANIPRYFIESVLGEHELGIFAALAYFIMLGATVSTALGQSASPRLARHYASGNFRAFRWLVLRLAGASAMGGALALLVTLGFGRQILRIAYTQEYADRSQIFSWLMLAAGTAFVSGFLTYGLTAARFLKLQVLLGVGIGAAMLTASALLIPRFGLLGAAWVTCLFYGLHITIKSVILFVITRERPAGRGGPIPPPPVLDTPPS